MDREPGPVQGAASFRRSHRRNIPAFFDGFLFQILLVETGACEKACNRVFSTGVTHDGT